MPGIVLLTARAALLTNVEHQRQAGAPRSRVGDVEIVEVAAAHERVLGLLVAIKRAAVDEDFIRWLPLNLGTEGLGLVGFADVLPAVQHQRGQRQRGAHFVGEARARLVVGCGFSHHRAGQRPVILRNGRLEPNVRGENTQVEPGFGEGPEARAGLIHVLEHGVLGGVVGRYVGARVQAYGPAHLAIVVAHPNQALVDGELVLAAVRVEKRLPVVAVGVVKIVAVIAIHKAVGGDGAGRGGRGRGGRRGQRSSGRGLGGSGQRQGRQQ